jgi:thioredoxin 1
MLSGINQYVNWVIGAVVLLALFLCLMPSNKSDIEPSTDAYFQATIANETGPVLVKFGAKWCPPCVSTDSALEEYDHQSNGEVKVVVIDVDSNHELTQHYGVRGIPHSFLFLNGKVIDHRVGGMDVETIKNWIKSNESSWKSQRLVSAPR